MSQMGSGVSQRKAEVRPAQVLRFAVLSLIGIFLFFVPAFSGQVTIVFFVNTIKGWLGDNLPYLGAAISIALVALVILNRVFHNSFAAAFYKDIHIVREIILCLSFVFVVLIFTKTAPGFIMDSRVGPNAISLAATIFLTVTIAGWAVVFILNSGIVEFIGVLIEPIMRPVYHLPGTTAVDAVSAFVSSSSVGIYLIDQHYQKKQYTQREAYAVASSFSVMSIGYMGVLCNITGIEEHYVKVVCATFVLVWIIAAIVVRIPPISLDPNTFIDGSEQSAEQRKVEHLENRFQVAVSAAVAQSETFTGKLFLQSLVNAVQFGLKVAGFIIPVVIVVLSIVYYTPVFSWISRPIVPILEALQLPDAALIAPSTIIGLIEVTLPSISISGLGVATQSCFFVVVLSAVQIIFFTECANAMFEAHFKASALKLIATFFVRTIVAIPLVAVVSHILF